MAFDDFHCVVLGNEPAGLWLLNQLDKAYRAQGETPKLGWVGVGEEPGPVCVPASLCSSLGMGSTSASWSAEICTPKRSFRWSQDSVADHFAQLPPMEKARDPLECLIAPSPQDRQAIEKAIAVRPDLIGFGRGLWKALGRTQNVSPQNAVHFLRFFTELQWWNPVQELPASVERLQLSATENRLESFESLRGGAVALQFKDLPRVSSKRWVMNLSQRSLFELVGKKPEFLKMLNVHWEPAALQALYPLRLTTEAAAIPVPVPALTLCFDTEMVPEPATQVWPLTLKHAPQGRELTLWTTAPALVSLEAVLDTFRVGMQRVHSLFPFLSSRLLQTSVALGMESCFSEEQRRQVADRLQSDSVEVYSQTGFYTETRHSAVSLLLPHMGCHLPYPVGSVLAARKMLQTLVPKKKKAAAPEPTLHA